MSSSEATPSHPHAIPPPAGDAAHPCGHCVPAAVHAPTVCLPLSGLRAGQTGLLWRLDLEPHDAALLRAMGLRPQALVRLCRVGDPTILEVLAGGEECRCASRIGLAAALTHRVLVAVSVDEPTGSTA